MSMQWEARQVFGLLDAKAFIGRLRDVRQAKGISAQALSESSGVPRNVIANMENGRRDGIDLDEAIALCKALDIDFVQVVTGQPIAVRYV